MELSPYSASAGSPRRLTTATIFMIARVMILSFFTDTGEAAVDFVAMIVTPYVKGGQAPQECLKLF
ncbi:hypothetical protein JFPO14_contig00013-0125 [Edwardsiella piscicida]|nr:hypothetical protein HI13_contig00003-0127 [Edwardsiella piscicida]GBK58771.1 hypothetical protein JFPO14_contig00013-0125 [Edwardsiella piscicida]